MKILIYSHDTFGLGHLRRARTIANHICLENPSAEILIVSGSSFGDAFSYPEQVQIVQIPPVQKQQDGTYQPVADDETMVSVIDARSAAIMKSYKEFRPDLLLVDKEPLGLQREMLETLQEHRRLGKLSILGLREVLDAPDFVKAEWDRKGIHEHLGELYEEIWIYGPQDFYDPLVGISLPTPLKNHICYTGFLERHADTANVEPKMPRGDFILVTSGGGGDGFELMKAATNAAQTNFGKQQQFVLALGAFMPEQEKDTIQLMANTLDNVRIVDFRADHEVLLRNAQLVVGMCGYNTFCEVVSFNKRAIFVPREKPRSEQAIRATRATEMGWSSTLFIDEASNAEDFANLMREAMQKPLPQSASVRPDLGGLSRINERMNALYSFAFAQAK